MGLPHYELLTMVNHVFVLVERVSSCCRSTSIITLLHGRNGPCHRTMELRSWNTLSKASKLQDFDFVLWKHIILWYVWCPWALSDTDMCPIPFLIWHSASMRIPYHPSSACCWWPLWHYGHESSHISHVDRGPSWNSQRWPSLPLRPDMARLWMVPLVAFFLTFIMFSSTESTDFPGIYHLVVSLEIDWIGF